MATTTKNLLKEYRLRSTISREEILSVFLGNDYALSHADIEKRIDAAIDRVTVYRTLKTFLKKGVIHKVLDDGGSAKYALCKDACSKENHQHDHVHFKCVKCGITNCLDGVGVPKMKLPAGYDILESNFLVLGICSGCNIN